MRISGLNRSLIAAVLCILVGSLPGLAGGSAYSVPAGRSPEHHANTPLQNDTSSAADSTERSRSDSPQLLDHDELEKLAQRSESPDQTIAGGALSNLHLTYVVIALAAAVVVLVLK